MEDPKKEVNPIHENLSELNMIEHKLDEMMLIECQISENSENLEDLFDSLTDNKSGGLNDEKSALNCHKNLNKSSKDKESKKKKRPKREDNTITSNTVRLLKLCIKEAFLNERQIYQSFMKFFSLHSIRSQLWAFDAILICILYMRDETRQINSDLFNSLSRLILERLTMIELRTNSELIKERIARYRSHCELYFHENRNFRKLVHMEEEIHDFFSSLVSKKKLVISQCMNSIKKIIRSIENKHYDSKSPPEAQKRRRTRAKTNKEK